MTEAGPAVRAAAPHERRALGGLLGALLDHHAHGPRYDVDPAAGDRDASLGSLLAPYLDHRDGRVFVVDGVEGPAGLISAAIARREAPFRERTRGHIEHLIVLPAARRAGVGRALVDRAVAWFRESGVARVELQVDFANPEGQAFWESLGFSDAARVLERRL